MRDRDADDNAATGNLGVSGSGLEERLYGLQDPKWNVTAVTETSGNVQERYGYSAYGKPTVFSSAFASRLSSVYDWETLYAAYRSDSESGVYHVRHRWLMPALGRWLSRDPASSTDARSVYAYVSSSPIRYIDPSGLGPLAPITVPELSGEYQGTPGHGDYQGIEANMVLSGAGYSNVLCCDADGNRISMWFYKICFGFGVGASWTIAGRVNLEGASCHEDSYTGWFEEIGVTAVGGSVSVDIGREDAIPGNLPKPWYGYLPGSEPTDTVEYGGGVADSLGASVKYMFCKYTFISKSCVGRCWPAGPPAQPPLVRPSFKEEWAACDEHCFRRLKQIYLQEGPPEDPQQADAELEECTTYCMTHGIHAMVNF